MTPEAYSHLIAAVFVAGVTTVLSVETWLEARHGLKDNVAVRALRRWASVGVALLCFVALSLDLDKGEGLLWVRGPMLFGPLLAAWLYLVRLVAKKVAFRLAPIVAFSIASAALLVASTYRDVPPFALVLAGFLGAATIAAMVVAYRSFAAERQSGEPRPDERDDS